MKYNGFFSVYKPGRGGISVERYVNFILYGHQFLALVCNRMSLFTEYILLAALIICVVDENSLKITVTLPRL